MRAKLFMNGRSQAVRLPAAFRFEGNEVEIENDPETGAVMLHPLRPSLRSWLEERNRVMLEGEISEEIAAVFEDLREPGRAEDRGWP
jgi:antitoxin VapB